MSRETVWACDLVTTLDGEPVFPDVLPLELVNTISLLARLPAPSGPAYEILATSVTDLFDVSLSFSLLVQEEVRQTEWSSLEEVIVQQLTVLAGRAPLITTLTSAL